MQDESKFWSARRILTELCDEPKRHDILTAFWKAGDPQSRLLATAHLAKALRFRDETIRKAPADKKAGWLYTRINAAEFTDCFEMALMVYHTTRQKKLLSAFLDAWGIPHVDGSIETDDYTIPSREQIESSVNELGSQFALPDILVYLATLGLLMGAGEPQWRETAWPVVEAMHTVAQGS
jgi:hypothetical protein